MSHLNYFEPYESKSKYHEDQLTRAFLVVLRYSPAAMLMFYDYCIKSIASLSKEKKVTVDYDLPHISDLDLDQMDFKTQATDVKLEVNQVISVLITDDSFNPKDFVEASKRNARYDGVITFSSNVGLVIENKPRNYNVWEAQLNPSIKSLLDGTQLVPMAAILEWKEIIKTLNSLLSLGSFGGSERMMVEDFLSFVDDRFPYLNPYDNFELCKNNEELIKRRIKNVFESIATVKEKVKYHINWAYYIETDWREILKIGLVLEKDETDWRLRLAMYFADTVGQARHFYQTSPSLKKLEALSKDQWKVQPNFHIGFMQRGVFWFNSPCSFQDYLKFWIDNQSAIKQYPKEEFYRLLEKLKSLDLISYDSSKQTELENKIKNMNNLNVCPGFGLLYTFNSNEAISLDKVGKFGEVLKSKILDGLAILNKSVNFIKN